MPGCTGGPCQAFCGRPQGQGDRQLQRSHALQPEIPGLHGSQDEGYQEKRSVKPFPMHFQVHWVKLECSQQKKIPQDISNGRMLPNINYPIH